MEGGMMMTGWKMIDIFKEKRNINEAVSKIHCVKQNEFLRQPPFFNT